MSTLKVRAISMNLPCEEGIDDASKDPRVPSLIQGINDLNAIVLQLQKQLANFTQNSISSSLQTTLPLTTKGDLLTRNSTEVKRLGVGAAGQVLTADSAQDLGLKWQSISYPAPPVGTAIYGDGADGDVSLGGDASLTASQYIFRYNNVSLNGHTLTGADEVTVIYIKGTLSLGGGILRCKQGTVAAAGASLQTGGTGKGGDGGAQQHGLFVFAKTITGTGSISSAGGAGTSGTQGGTTLENKLYAGGGSGSNTCILYGAAITPASGAQGTGGQTGGNGGTAATAINTLITKNVLAWLHITGRYIDTTSSWYNQFTNGGAGACAEAQAANGPAGAGGAGGAGWMTAGGLGGNGESRVGGTGGGGGGGGGGGSAGGVVIVITDSASSGLTVTASGGNGGAGGAKGSGVASGNSGGGGGGSGGFALLVAQAGSGATVLASPGGAGASGGGSAQPGNPGGAGLAMSLATT